MSDFYDRTASLYHLIFRDWDESIERQAGQLGDVIRERFGEGARTVLDVSCGIGTQAIGLAKRGFAVTASDLSAGRSRGRNPKPSVTESASTSRPVTCGRHSLITADNSTW